MGMSMKIGVLAAGITPEELIDQHGSYADMIMNLLNTTDQKFEFVVFDVRLDDFPNDLSEFDGWAISGSRNNVSENLPWMPKLTKGFESVVGDATEFSINAVHQDQVIDKPDNSEVLAHSDFCKNAGLIYGDLIMTFQAHPEFKMEFEKDLIHVRAGDAFPVEESKEALASLEGTKTDSEAVAQWFADFLIQHR